MADIPVPTLDQITGRTVMEKMRTLAKSFIEFANEIKDNVYTEEQVRDYVTSVLLNYYTKEEVDEAIAAIDLSDFYTKSETNGMLSLKRDISDSYNKTEVDTKDMALGNRIDACEDSISDLETNKQDVLTPVAPVEIDENNNISVNNVIVDDTNFTKEFKIKTGTYNLKIQLGNSSNLIRVQMSESAPFLKLTPSSIGFQNSNSGAENDSIRVTPTQSSFGSISGSTFYMSGVRLNIGDYYKHDSEVLRIISIPDDTRTYRKRCLVGWSEYGNSSKTVVYGIDLSSSTAVPYIFIGKKDIHPSANTDNKTGIEINYSQNTFKIYKNNDARDIITTLDYPTGKNLTDTVTFQDLVDLGLIKAPTTP